MSPPSALSHHVHAQAPTGAEMETTRSSPSHYQQQQQQQRHHQHQPRLPLDWSSRPGSGSSSGGGIKKGVLSRKEPGGGHSHSRGRGHGHLMSPAEKDIVYRGVHAAHERVTAMKDWTRRREEQESQRKQHVLDGLDWLNRFHLQQWAHSQERSRIADMEKISDKTHSRPVLTIHHNGHVGEGQTGGGVGGGGVMPMIELSQQSLGSEVNNTKDKDKDKDKDTLVNYNVQMRPYQNHNQRQPQPPSTAPSA